MAQPGGGGRVDHSPAVSLLLAAISRDLALPQGPHRTRVMRLVFTA